MHGASLKAHQRTYNKNSYFRESFAKKTLTFANSKKYFRETRHGVHTKLGPTWRCQSAQSREVFGMGVAASEGAWMGIASGKRCGGPVYF